MIDRSRWLRRLVTIASWVLVAALGIEAIMALMSDDVMRDLAYLLPYPLPMLFYLAGVRTIRQTFARLGTTGARGELIRRLLVDHAVALRQAQASLYEQNPRQM